MQSIVLVVHVILAMLVIGLVLIQHGKGADAGAAFGSGASSTVFGAKGSASFITKLTTGAALAFFVTSVSLFYLAAHRDTVSTSVVEEGQLPTTKKEESIPSAKQEERSELPSVPSSMEEKSDSDVPPAPESN